MLKQDRGFLLFSTCGHLIHERCVTNSLHNNSQFASNYSCFFCKTVSNLRLPLQPLVPNAIQAKTVFDELLTITSIYQTNYNKKLK